MSDAASSETAGDCDVAIVGYGPVGAFAGLLLAEAGLRVSIIDRESEIVPLPRAVGLDGESLRAFQRIGLADEIVAILQPPREHDRICFANSKHQEIFGQGVPARGIHGWRDLYFFDQPELEAVIRKQVEKHPLIETVLGVEFERFEQAKDGIILHGTELGSRLPWQRSAAFALGCDGASSRVRRELGVEWRSLGYDQDWLVIDILQGPNAKLPLVTMQVCDPARLTSYICVKDPNRRWEFRLNEGESREEMVQPERIEELLDPWLPADQYVLRRAAVYQFHAAIAERWSEGRILLAGDAAHQTPPFLGQGLNAGLRDAINLGWKLPLVMSGDCDIRLLRTYEEERAPHSLDLVEAAVRIGMLMETLAAREAGRSDPHADVPAPSGNLPAGRITPPLRAGLFCSEQLSHGSSAGDVFVQPRVRSVDGQSVQLDELYGRGFLIVGRDEASLRVEAAGADLLEQLGASRLSIEGLELVEGSFDRLFEKHAAALVRPDRYIYGVVDADWSLDRLLGELRRQLGLRLAHE